MCSDKIAMPMPKRRVSIVVIMLLLCVAVLVAFVLCVFSGSVSIPCSEVVGALFGCSEVSYGVRMVVVDLRLTSACVALLSGAALGACGLVLQTLFANDLAAPSLLGVHTGASLGVAVAMLCLGGTMALGSVSLIGQALIVAFAVGGALAVLGLILAASTWLRDNGKLLIVGLMVSFLGASVVGLLQYLSSSDGLQRFYVWGMGNFGGVSRASLPYYVLLIMVGLVGIFVQAKWLNALLLGEAYAINMGLHLRRVRTLLLALVGMLSAVITAYCGPIAFIGLAAPHLARLLMRMANHRLLLPATLLVGASLALVCHAVSHWPVYGQLLPLNVLTPLFGVPIVLYLVMRR